MFDGALPSGEGDEPNGGDDPDGGGDDPDGGGDSEGGDKPEEPEGGDEPEESLAGDEPPEESEGGDEPEEFAGGDASDGGGPDGAGPDSDSEGGGAVGVAAGSAGLVDGSVVLLLGIDESLGAGTAGFVGVPSELGAAFPSAPPLVCPLFCSPPFCSLLFCPSGDVAAPLSSSGWGSRTGPAGTPWNFFGFAGLACAILLSRAATWSLRVRPSVVCLSSFDSQVKSPTPTATTATAASPKRALKSPVRRIGLPSDHCHAAVPKRLPTSISIRVIPTMGIASSTIWSELATPSAILPAPNASQALS